MCSALFYHSIEVQPVDIFLQPVEWGGLMNLLSSTVWDFSSTDWTKQCNDSTEVQLVELAKMGYAKVWLV